MHSRSRPQTCHITRYFLKSISASSILSLFSLEESKEKNIGSDSKTSRFTTSKVTTSKLSSKKVPSLKLSTTFPTSIFKEKVSTISLNNQISAKESRDLVSALETVPKITQRPQASMLGLFNLIHKLAKSSFQLGNSNITYDTELYDGNYYILSLSGYSRHLETDTKVLSLSPEYLTCFIKKCSFEGCSVDQFPTILGVGSYV